MANGRMIHPYPGMFVASAREDGSIRSIRPDYFEWLKKKDASQRNRAGRAGRKKDQTDQTQPERQFPAE